MKRDIRKQTFSKPAKLDDEEIKKLTSDEAVAQPKTRAKEVDQEISEKPLNSPSKKNGAAYETKEGKPAEEQNAGKINPFLLSRGQTSEIGVEKTGYRLRSDYMDLLKLVKRMKKGYTLEAVLDDALTFYFENSEDGRKAVKHRQLLDSE
jgi:hypothetical protein